MTVQVAPTVATKLAQLAEDPQTLQRLSRLLETIRSCPDRACVLERLGKDVAELEGGVLVVRLGALRVFITLGDDYVLLLDLAISRGSALANMPGTRNLRADPKRNPLLNTRINPTFNTALNPVFNTSINPTFNTSLNPTFNTRINPVFNTSINPVFNTSTNPLFNAALNPKLNTTINPLFNPTYPGPYVYGLSLNAEAFLVRASDDLDLIFNLQSDRIGTAVRNESGGSALFDNSNKWIGYLVPDGQGGWLKFDLTGKWTGVVV